MRDAWARLKHYRNIPDRPSEEYTLYILWLVLHVSPAETEPTRNFSFDQVYLFHFQQCVWIDPEFQS